MKSMMRIWIVIALIVTCKNLLVAQWTQTSIPVGSGTYAWAYSGNNLFAGTLGGGVFLSTDNGSSWTAVNSGLTNLTVYSLVFSGTNLFAGTSGGGVFLSTDNGSSWSAVNSGLTITSVYALAFSGTNLFAGGPNGRIFISTNNGTSWTLAFSPGLTGPTKSIVVSGTYLFAGTNSNGVYRSTDNGTSWTAVNTGLTNTSAYCLAVSGTNLYAGLYGGGVFLSTNNGASWSAVNVGLTNNNVYTLAVSGANLFAGTLGGGVFLSMNNGSNWTSTNTGLSDTSVLSLVAKDVNLFAGTSHAGVFRRLLSEVLPIQLIDFTATVRSSSIELMWETSTEINSYGFEIERQLTAEHNFGSWNTIGFVEGAGTSNAPKQYSFSSKYNPSGKYSYRLKQMDRDGKYEYSKSVEVTVDVLPRAYELHQNYPNPANPSTTIRYAIPIRSHVTLSIFNTLSQKVAELVNGETDAGSYEVVFDATGLASGVYLYRMQAGSFVQTKKLVVVK